MPWQSPAAGARPPCPVTARPGAPMWTDSSCGLRAAAAPAIVACMTRELTVTVTIDAAGRVTVVSPGERMRVVATPAKPAAAAGQRVAELVAEALQGRPA